MPTFLLHCSALAVCPSKNYSAILSAPGHCGLRVTSGDAGEGDIIPYVSCHIHWCLREQWPRCPNMRGTRWIFLCICFKLKTGFMWKHWSVVSPPTCRLTVPADVPAELLATQLYCPASTSCTSRMCKVPRCTSWSTKGAEPTSSSPGKRKKWKGWISRKTSPCSFELALSVWPLLTFEPVDKGRRDACSLTCQSCITSNRYKYNLLGHRYSWHLWKNFTAKHK